MTAPEGAMAGTERALRAASAAAAGSERANGLARYGQLAHAWRQRIASGDWPVGSALPAEAELARHAGVALGTVRQALALLVAEGLLERVHGRGTFVTRGLAHASMLRFFRFGATPDGAVGDGPVPRSQLLGRRVADADPEQAALFGLDSRAQVLRLRRLRVLNERPVLLETIWLPLPAFEPLVQLPARDWDDLLYPMYSQRCGITIVRAVDDLSFDTLEAPEAHALGLDAGAACVRVERRAFELGGRCVEQRATLGNARDFRYRAEIR